MKEHKPCIAWETWITLVKNAQEKTGDASHWHRRCLIALMHSACLSRTTDSEKEHVEGLSLAFVKLSSSWPLGDASNRCQVSTGVRLRTTDQFCAVLAGGIFCLNMTDLCLRHRATPFPWTWTAVKLPIKLFFIAQFKLCHNFVFPAGADAEDWTSRQEKRHNHLGAIQNHSWRWNKYNYIHWYALIYIV